MNYQNKGDFCFILMLWYVTSRCIQISLKVVSKSIKGILQFPKALNSAKFCLDRAHYLELVFLLVFFTEKLFVALKIVLTLTGKYMRALSVPNREKKKREMDAVKETSRILIHWSPKLIFNFCTPSASDTDFAEVTLQKCLLFPKIYLLSGVTSMVFFSLVVTISYLIKYVSIILAEEL